MLGRLFASEEWLGSLPDSLYKKWKALLDADLETSTDLNEEEKEYYRSRPARVAVVHKRAEFGPLLTVLSRSASIIEDDAPDERIIQVARAA